MYLRVSPHLGDVCAAVCDGLGDLGAGHLEPGLAGEGGGRGAQGEELGQEVLQLWRLQAGGRGQAPGHRLHAVDGLRGLLGEHRLSPVVAGRDVGVLNFLLGPQGVVQHLLESSLGVGEDDRRVADIRGPELPHVDQLDAGHARKQEVVDVGGERDGVGHSDVGRGVITRGLKVVVVIVTVIFISLEKTFSLLVLIRVKLV